MSESQLQGWFADDLDLPMFIVTTAAGERRAGCLVGFATQCSIHPLRFVAFLSKNNRTYHVARDARVLAVHVVPADERELAELFGAQTGDDIDKFERCEWEPGLGGAPILRACSSWCAGPILQRVDAGDHVGFVLEPQQGQAHAGEALSFQAVRDLEAGHPA